MDFKKFKDLENPVEHEASDIRVSVQKRAVSRRPDIDCIRVCLTWGILLFHTTIAFIPEQQWYVTSKYPLDSALHSFAKVFREFMLIWNMPMFFFLSGISSFFALFKRNEQQYRDERVHRLLVPYLFAYLYMWMHSITYFAPNCTEYFESKNNGTRLSNCPSTGEYLNISFGTYTKKQFPSPNRPPGPGQAWFLLPLFVYSEMFAHLFTLWHPNHSKSTSKGIPCYGPSTCCTRPFSCCVKFFSCILCFGKSALTPEELVNSTVSWLGSWVKLG